MQKRSVSDQIIQKRSISDEDGFVKNGSEKKEMNSIDNVHFR